MSKFKQNTIRALLVITALFLVGLVLIQLRQPASQSQQVGYRGTGMAQLEGVETAAGQDGTGGALPAIHKPARVRANGPIAGTAYKNVTVLTELPIGEFGRTMTAMTDWVAGKESCNYCHVEGDFAADTKYTKTVARRMLQMVRHLNTTWKPHVGETGVTCYTCHRGNALPADRWFNPEPSSMTGAFRGRQPQNQPSATVRLAALPNDPYIAFLKGPETVDEIRVAASNPLAMGRQTSVQNAEKTYGLMLHLTQALGVNCTYCHNSRAFASWPESSPARATAWKGIRMVRDLNNQFMEPLSPVFPKNLEGRLGPTGDAAKVNCATCHQGVNKPIKGFQMARHYPGLLLPYAAAAPASAAAPAAAETPASAASAPEKAASSPLELMAAAPAQSASSAAPVAARAPALTVAAAAYPATPPMAPPNAPPAAPVVAAAATLVPEPGNCLDLGVVGSKAGVPVARDSVARQVVGAGRVALYSAPDKGCEMLGVFAQAGESLEASLDHAGYTAVRYLRAKSGAEVRGWVRSERLVVVAAAKPDTRLAQAAVAAPPAKPLPAPGAVPVPAVVAARAPAPVSVPAPAPVPAPVTVVAAAAAAAAPDACRSVEAAAAKGRQAPAGGAGRRVVVGAGRLQFYAAPDLACTQKGVFILAGESVEALEQFGEFTTVRYVNPRTGAEARGWVSSGRLAGRAQVVSQASPAR